MIPILYSPEEAQFESLGLGLLSETIRCSVVEEINGEFELEMVYPITGRHFKEISNRSIILAKPSPYMQPQPFRVYSMSTTIKGRCTINARHISYDLAGYVVEPFTIAATNINDALASLKTHILPEGCPFTFSTDKNVESTFTVTEPMSVRATLGGQEGSLLDIYAGQYLFDRFNVALNIRRGADRGMTIRYGKNMTDYQQDQNCENVYTGIYPFWSGELTDGENKAETQITLDEKIIFTEGTFDYAKIMTKDWSGDWTETDILDQYFPEQTPTKDEVIAKIKEKMQSETHRYLDENEVGIPKVSWDISFIQLSQSADATDAQLIQELERVDLGDTVKVYFTKIGVAASSKVIKTTFDVLADRYTKITLGSVKNTIADRVVQVEKEKEEADTPTKSWTTMISESITKNILGANDGTIRFIDTNGDGDPDTLYIADNPNPAEARHIWRFNSEGWAATDDGYNGNWIMGGTLERGLLANFITAAHLTAGTIQSVPDAQGNIGFYVNLDTSEVSIGNGQLQYLIDPVTGIGSLTIGERSSTHVAIDNDSVDLMDGTTMIASFSITESLIPKVKITEYLHMGDKWEVSSNSGYSIKWIGD